MDKIICFLIFTFFLSCSDKKIYDVNQFQKDKFDLVYSQGLLGFSYKLMEDSLICNLSDTKIANQKLNINKKDENIIVGLLYDGKLLNEIGAVNVANNQVVLPKADKIIKIYKNSKLINQFTISPNTKINYLNSREKRIFELYKTIENILTENKIYQEENKKLKKYIIDNKLFLL